MLLSCRQSDKTKLLNFQTLIVCGQTMDGLSERNCNLVTFVTLLLLATKKAFILGGSIVANP